MENKKGGKAMKKIWLAVAGMVLILAVVVGLVGCNSEDGLALSGDTSSLKLDLSGQQQGIWVSGTGKVYATPDIAILTLGIEAQADTVAVARDQAAIAMEAVIAALEAQGIEESDIQTQYFNITQVTRWDSGKESEDVTGYRVTNTVTVKVREIEKAGDFSAAGVAAGGDLTRISDIDFTIDEPQSYYEDAREKAIEYAMAKAQQLAEKAGVDLGSVTYISESSGGYITYRNYAVAEDAAVPGPAVDTSISAGQLEITATVQMTYAIAD
jgi:uncharacterized protein YggE